VLAERNDDRFILDAQHRRMSDLRSSRQILDRCTLLPFGHRLRVDPVTLGQGDQALLTMLYRSTDCLCRTGAAM
jgi:hypothetical protein